MSEEKNDFGTRKLKQLLEDVKNMTVEEYEALFERAQSRESVKVVLDWRGYFPNKLIKELQKYADVPEPVRGPFGEDEEGVQLVWWKDEFHFGIDLKPELVYDWIFYDCQKHTIIYHDEDCNYNSESLPKEMISVIKDLWGGGK